MKIKEAIKKLKEIQTRHGNIDLKHFSGESGYPDGDIDFDVYYEKPGKEGNVICAYACRGFSSR